MNDSKLRLEHDIILLKIKIRILVFDSTLRYNIKKI